MRSVNDVKLDQHLPMGKVDLSLVIPAYNEGPILRETYKELKRIVESLGLSYELVFVNDGSTDNSREIFFEIAALDKAVKVVLLARNFGHELATTAGLAHAQGKAVIVIDADLQDPPELIPDMVSKWKEGYDVVYGVRTRREGESTLKRFTALLFYRFLAKISEVPLPKDTGDFRLMDRKVVEIYRTLKEDPRFFRGLIAWIGFRQIGIPFVRRSRIGGVSKYRYAKLLQLAFDTLTAFSTYPSLLISIAAGGLFSLTLLGTFALVALDARSWIHLSLTDWLLVAALQLMNIQFCAMAVLGEYVVRTHRHTQQRPLYIVDQILNEAQASRHEDELARSVG